MSTEQELLRLRRSLEEEVAKRVAEMEQSAEALRQKEAFNFALFQHSPLPATVVDRSGLVVKSNLARRQSGEELPALGSRLYEGTEGQYEVDMRAALEKAIASGEAAAIPEQRHGDRWVAVTIAPFPGGAIVTARDVTARRRAEEESRRQQQQLIHAHKMVALGTLVSGVAHEVSNPNNIMILSTSALRKIVDNLLPVLDEYRKLNGDFSVGSRPYAEIRQEIPELVDTIGRAAERIKTLVNDLKDFARKDIAERTESVDVNKVVKASVTLLSALIRRATDSFHEHYSDDVPPVEGKGQRLEQVVVNLLTNACQALPEKDRAIRVTTRFDQASRRVIVQVRDEGVGIPPAHLPRVTDPFFTTKHDTGGTGLGLSISQNIIEAHGGTLAFESKVGQGTTVTISLPARAREGGAA